MEIEVGKMYYFKLNGRRGRPFVGEVVRKAGIFTEFMNKGKLIKAPTKYVSKPYSFKPYGKKAA